jgi:hypothetical protein
MRDRISHYSGLMDEVIAHYELIREAMEKGDPLGPDVFIFYSDIAQRGTVITDMLDRFRNNEENLVTPEAIAKLDKYIVSPPSFSIHSFPSH